MHLSVANAVWVLAENREIGENPIRYRHCIRGGAARDESQPLGDILRRQCGGC